MKNLSFLIVLTLFAFQVYSSNTETYKGVVTGFVIDAKTEKPVEYANIVIYSISDSTIVTGAVSAEDGSFKIEKLEYGKYYIVTNFIGYEKNTISQVVIDKKNTAIKTIFLKPATQNIDEVKITVEKQLVEYKIDKKVINVSKSLNAEGGTAIDVLQNAPSVQVDGSGTVTLRGSSSFTVLIDGRPTMMTGSEALQNIPASTIESIEIITNPSAKYDPDGVSGIINLKMKKQKLRGFNGVINTNIGTGEKYTASGNFNYKIGKFNFFVGGDYSHKKQITESGTDLELYQTDTLFTTIRTDRTTYRNKYSIKSGIDYFINDKNTISVSGGYGFWQFERLLDNNFHDFTSDLLIDNYKTSDDVFDIKSTYVTANSNFQHIFNDKGHEISFDIFYSNADGETPYDLKEYETDLNYNIIENSLLQKQMLNSVDRNAYRLKTDYVLPINEKNKIELGYQSDFNFSDRTFIYKELINNEMTINVDLSNNLNFTRNIHSAYTMFTSELFGFQYQLGLRGEYSQRYLKQNLNEDVYDFNKFSFFPTVHISRQLPKGQEIQLSYSRRITRPKEWFLNPNPSTSDSYTVEVGNPNLQPDYTSAYELNYQKRFKKSFISAGLFYRHTINAISRTLLASENKMIMTYANINNEKSGGIELMNNLSFTKWWSINASANVYYTELEGNVENGGDISQSTITGNGRFMNTFSLKTNTYLQFMAVYYAPGVFAQGTTEDFYYFDFIIKQYFFKRKLSLSLRTHNTFDTGKYIYTTNGTNYSDNSFYNYEGPVFLFGLSYKINNYKQKNRETIEQNFESGMD